MTASGADPGSNAQARGDAQAGGAGLAVPGGRAPRILDARASHFARMTALQLFDSIRRSEGRTLAAEMVAPAPTLVDGISNPELAAAFGVDLLVLNLYDVRNPWVTGLPDDVPASPHAPAPSGWRPRRTPCRPWSRARSSC